MPKFSLRTPVKKEYYLLILLIFVFAFGSCKYKELEIGKVSSTEILFSSPHEIIANITIQIDNPNTFKIKINEVDLDFMVNDKTLGRVVSHEKIVIDSKGEHDVVFPLKLRFKGVLGGAMMMLNMMGKSNVDVKITGKIYARALLKNIVIEVNEVKSVDLNELRRTQ